MRLIDVDALKDKLQQHHDFYVMAWGGFGKMPIGEKKRVNEITNCIAEVVNAPTIEPKRGEWVEKPHKVYLPRDYEPDIIDYRDRQYNEEDHSIIQYWWHCNKCDYEADRLSKPIYNYCPNCGCWMKGADDD